MTPHPSPSVPPSPQGEGFLKKANSSAQREVFFKKANSSAQREGFSLEECDCKQRRGLSNCDAVARDVAAHAAELSASMKAREEVNYHFYREH